MIQINYLTVEYERKFNLGNFESVAISAGVQAKVEDENPQEVLQLLMDIAKETVRGNIPPSYRNHNPSVTETFFKNGQRCDPKTTKFLDTALDRAEEYDPGDIGVDE